jgi:hypothetical protein
VSYRAPNEHEAGERAWEVVRAAYESREPVTWPRRHARPLIAGALVTAVVAAALSPPGRSVVHSFRKAVGVKTAQPELFSLPAPGQLLVTSRSGAWVVHADGSRRRLGNYRDAAFSPHGLFIAATRGNELVALDPKGGVRWTLARRRPRLPAWTGTRMDTRIAYIAGGGLRVVAGDGTSDQLIGEAAPVQPAWRPGPGRVVAYSSGRSAVVLDLDHFSTRLRTPPGEAPTKLEWSSDGRLLLVLTPHALRVYDRQGRVVAEDDPSEGNADVDAAFVPGTHRVVAIRVHGAQSDVFMVDTGRTLFRGTGDFRRLVWSPNGRWLLITWPTANQWVFVKNDRPRRIVGASRISAQFGSFPRVAGWCCAR